MTLTESFLCGAVVLLGFLALWSQFGRRVALQAAFLVAGSLAVVMAGQPIDWSFTDMLSFRQLMGKEGEPTIIRCNSPMTIYRG